VLGLTYKADIDDTRESPAIEICNQLSGAGAVVMAHDPYIEAVQYETFSNSEIFEEAIADCDLLAFLVPHSPFRSLVPDEIKKLTRARLVVDAVNIVDPAEWQEAGFQVRRLGVGI
jgi:UDP-N-acetyl-D-mannosaminuronate dehydrogenase